MKGVLTRLAWSFGTLSLVAFGGINVIVPGMQHAVVDPGWMSEAEFTRLFAIGQAMPGPNLIVVPLLGWRVAGLAGAAVATVAMLGPSTALLLGVSSLWHRHRETRVVRAARRGLAPLAVGLVLASGWILTRDEDQHAWAAYLLTAATAFLAMRTRWNPLWLLLGGALMGWLGWV